MWEKRIEPTTATRISTLTWLYPIALLGLARSIVYAIGVAAGDDSACLIDVDEYPVDSDSDVPFNSMFIYSDQFQEMSGDAGTFDRIVVIDPDGKELYPKYREVANGCINAGSWIRTSCHG